MKLLIEQHVFSWNVRFSVFDEDGKQQYFVEGEPLSMKQKLHVYDRVGHEVFAIWRELLSVPAVFQISVHGHDPVELRQELSLLRPRYRLDAMSWDVTGDFLGFNYQITRDDAPIARVHKELMDRYTLEVASAKDVQLALAVVLAIDCANANG